MWKEWWIWCWDRDGKWLYMLLQVEVFHLWCTVGSLRTKQQAQRKTWLNDSDHCRQEAIMGWEERESSFHELYLKAIEKPTMIRKQKEANWAFEQTIQNTFQISMLSKHVERRDNRNDCSDETEVFHLIEREVWIEFDHVIESTPEGSHFVLKEPTIPRKHTRDYSL